MDEELKWSCPTCTFRNCILEHPECCEMCSTVRESVADSRKRLREDSTEVELLSSYSVSSTSSSSAKRPRVNDPPHQYSRSFMGNNIYRNVIDRHTMASADDGALSLESLFHVDLIHKKTRDPQLVEVFISGYCGTDAFVNFIKSLNVDVTLVAHWKRWDMDTDRFGRTAWKETTQNRYNGNGNVITNFHPPMSMPFGTFHPKLYMMKFKSFLRVVIHSANMEFIPDWRHMGQNIWMQDFPYCDRTVKSPTGFEDDLRDFLEQALRKKVDPKEPGGLKMIVDGRGAVYTVSDVDHVNRFLADKIDWSGCTVHIVASVPGRHTAAEGAIDKYGYRRVGSLISLSQKSLPITPTAIVCQGSSMGYKKVWYNEVMSCLTGSTMTTKSTNPLLKIVFPSKATVHRVIGLAQQQDGYAGENCILFEEKLLGAINNDAYSYVKFIDLEPPALAPATTRETDIGSLDLKELKRQLTTRGINFTSFIEKGEFTSALRDSVRRGGNAFSYGDILLHSKFIISVHNDASVRPWMYCGSHNLSKAAWGVLEKGSQLNVMSWELGVFFPAVPYDDSTRPFNLTFNPYVTVTSEQQNEYFKKRGGPFTFGKHT